MMRQMLLFILLIFWVQPLFADEAASSSSSTFPETESMSVEKVMDGDTFKLTTGQNLKLAGINAPELHDTPKLPQEAKRFNQEIWQFRNLGDDAQRRMEKFVREAGDEILVESSAEAFDEKGNLLSYVFVLTLDETILVDGTIVIQHNNQKYVFLNLYLLDLGLAELSGPVDSKYEESFSAFELKAKNQKRGLWSK